MHILGCMKYDLLRIENIGKTYRETPILKNINFQVKPGEIIGIIGSSGSGKTTLLHTIIGFTKPDTGDVKFRQRHLVEGIGDYEDVYRSIFKKPDEFKRTYGFAAQVPSFYEKLTVKENLEYFSALYGLGKEATEANITTLLKLLNLENNTEMLGKNLSGGMERRLDIACSLIHNPELLLLDEPTADLDPVLRKNIWDMVKKINNKGKTIILSSHHLNELEALCDRIAIIMDGNIIEFGTPTELKKKFLKAEEILVQSYPGNYEEIKPKINKELKKKITNVSIEEGLVVRTENPHEVLNNIIKIFEKEKEKILELRLTKPSLDELFISLQKKK